jgi:hypothetical protein
MRHDVNVESPVEVKIAMVKVWRAIAIMKQHVAAKTCQVKTEFMPFSLLPPPLSSVGSNLISP